MCWSTETWKKMIWLEDRDSTALKYLNIHYHQKEEISNAWLFLLAISFLC